MTLRKITIDDSVGYIPKNEQTKEQIIQPNTKKASSPPRKQNKNISRNNKTFLKDVAASGFAILK